MTELSFEWDPRKAAANAAKHGVTFEEARTVFHDEHALLIDDPDHSKSEARFILLGRSVHERVLVVVHCLRQGGKVIRLISARLAGRQERKTYEEKKK
ncbi:MAG: BrnT family toxin [Betaproteobacteria bacterium]|nr:BrnT family toxin [Verrucomicrobiota bacterium]NBQ80390.1 BrnT family toxin [Betaproteobacteria bacterium]